MAIEVEGLEEFQRELAQFQENLANYAQTAGDEVRMVVEQGLMIMQGEAADYPAQPGDADYRRTGTLGRMWVSAGRVIEGRVWGGMVGRVGNATPYGEFVQDPDKQAWFHAEIWRDTEEIAKVTRDDVEDLLSSAGVRISRRLLEGIL